MLLEAYTLRRLTLRNRIVVSPMCHLGWDHAAPKQVRRLQAALFHRPEIPPRSNPSRATFATSGRSPTRGFMLPVSHQNPRTGRPSPQPIPRVSFSAHAGGLSSLVL